MKKLSDYIDSRFSPDRKLCKNKAYKIASMRFNCIISELEKKYPESKEIIFELIIARAVLETATAKHMLRKGLSNRWKAHSQETGK